MFKAIAKGYGATVVIGIAGYLAIGGPLWVWALLVWIGGAPVTLFFTGTQDEATDSKPVVARSSRPLSWFSPSFGKTRLDGGS